MTGTPQFYLGLAAALIAALVGFLEAADAASSEITISPYITLVLGAIDAVLAAAVAFISSVPKMTAHLWKNNASEIMAAAPPGVFSAPAGTVRTPRSH